MTDAGGVDGGEFLRGSHKQKVEQARAQYHASAENVPGLRQPMASGPNTWDGVERRGALAGSESAVEHVRNALQLLQTGDHRRVRIGPQDIPGVVVDEGDLAAARARLARALALVEGQ